MDIDNSELPKHPEGYHDTGEHAYRERNLEMYKSMVFRDSTDKWLSQKPEYFDSNDPMTQTLMFFNKIDHYMPGTTIVQKDPNVQYDWDWQEETVFGGFDSFFSDNARILDLGSGHGQVVQEINKKYGARGIKCYGVDYRYSRERPEDSTNLVAGNFKALPFQDSSFNKLLSVESFPAWIPDDRNLIEKYFQEITRISHKGTIWRGTLPTYDDYETPFLQNQELISYFTRNGWELVIDHENISFIARLAHKEGTE